MSDEDEVSLGEGASDESTLTIERTPLLLWAGFAVVSVVVRSISAGTGWSLDRWDALAQWESGSHLGLADNGLRKGDEFVFPGYGALVRLTTWITGNRITTAVLITYVAAAAASWLLWEWLSRREVDRPTRTWAVLALLAFPYSFVLFGVVGSEALCLALALGAFVLLERDQPVAAGLVGALAITTSLSAVAIIPAFIVVGWQARSAAAAGADVADGADGAAGARKGAGSTPAPIAAPSPGGPFAPAVLTLLGPIAVSVYCWIAIDDPMIPWRGDGGLRGLSTGLLRPSTWIRLAWAVDDGAPASWTFHRGAQAALLIGSLVALYWVAKRFGTAIAVFVLGVTVAAVIGDIDTVSAGRRLTLAFPLAALAAVGLARLRRPVAIGIVVLSSVGMFALSSYFVRSIGFPYW